MSLLGLLATAGGAPVVPAPTRPTSLDGSLTTRLASWGRVAHRKSTGPVTSTTTHAVPVEADGIKLHWGNVVESGNGVYAANATSITVSASIATSSGSHPVTWGGNPTVTITGGAIAASDAVGWAAAGSNVVVTATVTGTGDIPTMRGYSDGTGAYLVGPLAITGGTPTSNTARRWLVLGDSVSEGVGDTLYGRSGQEGTGGYMERLLSAAGRPSINAAASGERYNQLTPTVWDQRIGTLGGLCDSAFVGYAINDIQVYTATQLADMLIEGWQLLHAKGISRVYQATVLPRTDAAGTTVSGDPTQRAAWNAWLRDGAPGWYQAEYSRWQGRPTGSALSDTKRIGQTDSIGGLHPLTGVLDVAAIATSATTPNTWKTGWTSDGVHPNAVGHAGIAAGLTLP